MTLTVIIATYNRSGSLARAIDSLRQMPCPPGLRRTILVVDNHSTDDTRAVVAAQIASDPSVRYLYEPQQGQVFARNAGIRASTSELIAFIDDDETIAPTWYAEIARVFADASVEFAGGPYLPQWEITPPAWLTPPVAALLGAHNPSPIAVRYDQINAVLPGGNCVFRRSLINRVGLYAAAFGHVAGRVLGNDDTELYRRIQADGALGWYLPAMAITHHIPAARMTKPYARRLQFWGGVANGRLDRAVPDAVPRVAGIPRYLLGAAMRRLPLAVRTLGRSTGLEHELVFRALAGFLYGRLQHHPTPKSVIRWEAATAPPVGANDAVMPTHVGVEPPVVACID